MPKTESYPLLTRLLLTEPQLAQMINKTAWNEHAGASDGGVYFHGGTSVQPTALFRHQPAAENPSSCNYYNSSKASQQSSSMQTRTHLPPNGRQCIYYQDSRFLNPQPPQSSPRKPSTEYLQQSTPAQWKPQGVYQQTQTLYHLPHDRSGDTGTAAKPAATTTSLPHPHTGYTGQSFLTHNNQAVYNPCTGDSGTQRAYLTKPLNYTPQPRTDGHVKVMPAWQDSRVGQRAQQRPAQFRPTLQSKGAVQQSVTEEVIQRIADDLRNSYPMHQSVSSPTHNGLLHTGAQSNVTHQPVPTNSPRAGQPSVCLSGGGLSGLIPVAPPTQAASPQKSPCIVLNLLMFDQHGSSGREARGSQPLETQSAEDDPVGSPPGRTNSRAVAVVQPLSQRSCSFSGSGEAFDTASSKSSPVGSWEYPPEMLEKTVTSKTLADQRDPPSNEPRSQSCEPGDDPGASSSKTSSGVTVAWTVRELQKLIQSEEAAQQICSDSLRNCRLKLHRLFLKELSSSAARKSVYQFLMECKSFVKNHVTADTVLAQREPGFEIQPEHDRVLRDGHLYSEPPFRSSWLNTNHQLDDIDKEFGFPACLRYAGGQPDLVTAASVNRGRTPSGASGKDSPRAEPKRVESGVEMQVDPKPADSDAETQRGSVESSPVPAALPADTGEDSGNPFYSFEIQVWPPEDAKLFYEQTESPERRSKDARVDSREPLSQPDKDAHRSEAAEVSMLDLLQLDETDVPTNTLCCLSKVVGKLLKSSLPLGNCQCVLKKPVKAVIDLTEDGASDESAAETMDAPGKSPGDAIVLTDEDASVEPEADAGPDSASVQSMSCDGCESEVEDPGGGAVEISSRTSEGEEKKLSDASSDSSVEKEEQPLPDVDVAGNERRAQRSAVSQLKRSRSRELPQEAESQLPTRPDVSVAWAARKRVHSNVKAAKLVLYGSEQQDPMNKRKRHFSSQEAVCTISKPPEVLSVPLPSLKRQLSAPLPVREESAKNRIFEIWKKSFPVTPMRRRAKKCAFTPGEEREKTKKTKLKLRRKDGSKRRAETSGISPAKSRSEKKCRKPSTHSVFVEFKEKYMRRKRQSSV